MFTASYSPGMNLFDPVVYEMIMSALYAHKYRTGVEISQHYNPDIYWTTLGLNLFHRGGDLGRTCGRCEVCRSSWKNR